MWENKQTHSFAFCATEVGGEKGTFDSILNLKDFTDGVKFRWQIKKLL
jgi:hypothetical protein